MWNGLFGGMWISRQSRTNLADGMRGKGREKYLKVENEGNAGNYINLMGNERRMIIVDIDEHEMGG